MLQRNPSSYATPLEHGDELELHRSTPDHMVPASDFYTKPEVKDATVQALAAASSRYDGTALSFTDSAVEGPIQSSEYLTISPEQISKISGQIGKFITAVREQETAQKEVFNADYPS